jgi:hypothetical protein
MARGRGGGVGQSVITIHDAYLGPCCMLAVIGPSCWYFVWSSLVSILVTWYKVWLKVNSISHSKHLQHGYVIQPPICLKKRKNHKNNSRQHVTMSWMSTTNCDDLQFDFTCHSSSGPYWHSWVHTLQPNHSSHQPDTGDETAIETLIIISIFTRLTSQEHCTAYISSCCKRFKPYKLKLQGKKTKNYEAIL